ncbi:MAG: hypothetical protein ACK4QP_16290, partial [Pseudorhizobium sp.]
MVWRPRWYGGLHLSPLPGALVTRQFRPPMLRGPSRDMFCQRSGNSCRPRSRSQAYSRLRVTLPEDSANPAARTETVAFARQASTLPPSALAILDDLVWQRRRRCAPLGDMVLSGTSR